MRSIVLIVITLITFSCSKESIEKPVLLDPTEYFPLDSGMYWMYDATFILIDAAVGTFDTSHFELKMKYEYFDIDIQQYVLERVIRKDSLEPWLEFDIITISWDELTMQWVEDDLRFVKLTDPIYENKSWDGNSYNILDDWNYYYSDVNTSFEVNNQTYSSTVRVEKRDVVNFIQQTRAYEIFAKDIGIVYEYVADFSYQGPSVNVGQSRELKLIKFGIE